MRRNFILLFSAAAVFGFCLTTAVLAQVNPTPTFTQSSASTPTQAASGNVGGLGALTAVPAGTTNGTPLGTPPAGMTGVRFYLPANASVTYTVAAAQPTSAPALTFTTPTSTVSSVFDEGLSGEMIYVTAVTGSPLFRWR